MSIFNAQHPEITAGSLPNFGFYKISQQVKTIFVNMIQDFADQRNAIFKNEMAEVDDIQNSATRTQTTLHVIRDFSAFTRKFPSIVISVDNSVEQKPYIGADNFLYTNKITTSTGVYYEDIYAGMAEIDATLTIVAESSDARAKLADLLYVCFGNYYRGQFIYKGDDGSQYIITPSVANILFGSEQEANENPDTLATMYISTLSFKNHIEYHYPSSIDGPERYTTIENISMLPPQVVEVPIINF